MKKVRYISLLLLALFVDKLVSDTLLTHTHSYDWGAVTHSHPFSQKSHDHSANELLSIATASHAAYTTPDNPVIVTPEHNEISIIWFYAEKCYDTIPSVTKERAPPVLG